MQDAREFWSQPASVFTSQDCEVNNSWTSQCKADRFRSEKREDLRLLDTGQPRCHEVECIDSSFGKEALQKLHMRSGAAEGSRKANQKIKYSSNDEGLI